MQLSTLDEKRIDRWNKILSDIKYPMTIPVIAHVLNCSKDTMRNDCQILEKMGYLQVENKPKVRGRALTYLPIYSKLDMKDYVPFEKREPESYTKRNDAEQTIESLKHGRMIFLTDKVHHARMPEKKRSAWIGTTLGTMSY
jgi:DeoR/GlpR family transcriptional regulator of sugar metabolism